VTAWHHNFFDGLYGRVLAHQFDTDRSRREARLVKRLLRVRRGSRVLDVPCGQGRLTLPLARLGLRMTGLDVTPAYVLRARRRARAEGLDVRFLRGDMRDIPFRDEFHAAFNWFSSLGYFSDDGNLDACRAAFRALRPGGRFLVDVVSKSRVLARFRAREEHTIGGVHVRIRNRWDPRAQRIRGAWTLARGQVTERHRIDMRLYSGADLRRLLRQAGFRDVRFYGRPPLGPLTRHSPRLVAVATKPRA